MALDDGDLRVSLQWQHSSRGGVGERRVECANSDLAHKAGNGASGIPTHGTGLSPPPALASLQSWKHVIALCYTIHHSLGLNREIF